MKYTEVKITLSPIEPYRDLLIDALGNEGPYDSFVETADGLKAYVPEALYDAEWLQSKIGSLMEFSTFQYSLSATPMPDKNWNEEWEKQHQPILVEADNGMKIWVRAPFHEHRTDVDYEIEIEPKMSFGTAHHSTTYMMIAYLAELPLEGLRVLDMGCGTAVLGILAKMRNAAYVEGIDVDEWAYSNAIENVQRNGVEMTIRMGGASLLEQSSAPFDLIIANINRNILLSDMAAYTSALAKDGTLLLSGFYESDIPSLEQHASAHGLQPIQRKIRQNWAALCLKKMV